MGAFYRCVACGRPCSGSERFCPSCHACLLVDVLVEAGDHDRRAIYMAAREIDLLGREAPTFEEARLRLLATPSKIAPDCSRAMAARIVNVLRKHGIPTQVLPLRRPSKIRPEHGDILRRFRLSLKKVRGLIRGLPLYLRVSLCAFMLLGAGAVLWVIRGAEPASENPTAVMQSHAGHPLSTREIVFAALRSNVEIRADGSVARAFFVAPDLLVSNAPVGEGDWVEVIRPDGIRDRGGVEKSDPWIGLSLIRVENSGAPFLGIGDAALLERGQALSLVGRLEEEKFSATQGILTSTDLVDFGRLYYVIDASFAEVGTPVLDSSARVIGVVTGGIQTGKGSFPVIPINYLTNGKAAMLPRPRPPAADKRWQERMDSVHRKDAAEFARVEAGLDHPSIFQAQKVGTDALDVGVWEFVSFPPSAGELFFDLVRGDEILCQLNGTADSWLEYPAGNSHPALDRQMQWLRHHDPKGRLYTASLHLVTWACTKDISGASLLLPSGNPSSNRVPIVP